MHLARPKRIRLHGTHVYSLYVGEEHVDALRRKAETLNEAAFDKGYLHGHLRPLVERGRHKAGIHLGIKKKNGFATVEQVPSPLEEGQRVVVIDHLRRRGAQAAPRVLQRHDHVGPHAVRAAQAGAPAMVERYAAAPGAQLHLPIADARYLGAGHRAVYHQVPAVAARLFGQVRQKLTVDRQRPALAGRRRQY